MYHRQDMLALVLALVLTPEASGGEQRALWTAIDDVRRSQAIYEAVLAHPNTKKLRPFARILRAKKRHEKRLVKVAIKRGYGDPPVQWNRSEVIAPGDKRASCAMGVDQELRNAAIYETAMAIPLSGRAQRVIRRIHRRVRNHDVPDFEACVRLAK
jgi:hypothetical protein